MKPNFERMTLVSSELATDVSFGRYRDFVSPIFFTESMKKSRCVFQAIKTYVLNTDEFRVRKRSPERRQMLRVRFSAQDGENRAGPLKMVGLLFL